MSASTATGVALLRKLWKNRELLRPILEAIEAVIDVAKITIEVRKRKADGVQRHDIVSIDSRDLLNDGLDDIAEFERDRGGFDDE